MLSDQHVATSASAGSNPLLGDTLVLVGATGYGFSNVLTEHVLERASPTELLTGLGGFGFLWSAASAAMFERHALAQVVWSARVVGALVTYTATLFSFYGGAMLLLQRSGSVVRSLFLCASAAYMLDAVGFAACTLHARTDALSAEFWTLETDYPLASRLRCCAVLQSFAAHERLLFSGNAPHLL